jgi:hypothetical protein
MLVGTHNRTVNEDFLKVGVARKLGEYRSHICARDHLAKRWYTLFHAPKSGGKSRHGLPVRAIHSTASTNSRLSPAVRPGSVPLPGSKRAIRSYWSSLSISLGILFFRKRQDVNSFPHKLTAPSVMIVNTP